jgi:hypothetical protein
MPAIFLSLAPVTRKQMIDDKLSASELMTTSLIALPPVVPVRRLIDTLRMCNHQVRGSTSAVLMQCQCGTGIVPSVQLT